MFARVATPITAQIIDVPSEKKQRASTKRKTEPKLEKTTKQHKQPKQSKKTTAVILEDDDDENENMEVEYEPTYTSPSAEQVKDECDMEMVSTSPSFITDKLKEIIEEEARQVKKDIDAVSSRDQSQSNSTLTDETELPWDIIGAYYKDYDIERHVRHQLESFNYFVDHQIEKTIDMFNTVHIRPECEYSAAHGLYGLEIFITFNNFHLYQPQINENNGAVKIMFPYDARLRNYNYASTMVIDVNIKYVIRGGDDMQSINTIYKTFPKVHIGKLPIMLKSNICVLSQYKHIQPKDVGECEYDAGGYFIIKGSEKVVLGQERAAENRICCYPSNNTKYSVVAELRSVPDYKTISPKQINMFICVRNNGYGCPIYIEIPRVKNHIPLFVVFRALGITSDAKICEYILLNMDDLQDQQQQDYSQQKHVGVSGSNSNINYTSSAEMYNSNGKQKRIEMLKMLQASIIDANEILSSNIKSDRNAAAAAAAIANANSGTETGTAGAGCEIDSTTAAAAQDGKSAFMITFSQEDAIRYIASNVTYVPFNTVSEEQGKKKKYSFALDVLKNDLFPHCRTINQKIYYLGYMTNCIIQNHFGWTPKDERDDYLNKRVDTTGVLLNNLFRNNFNKLVKDMEKAIIKEVANGSWKSNEDYGNIVNYTNIYKIIKSTTIENGFNTALSTGNFSIKNTNSNKVGVAQVLNRLSYPSSISHLRRISATTDKSGKLIPPRKLHSSSWGYICPFETPEGPAIGIVKNLSMLTHIPLHSDSTVLHEYIEQLAKNTIRPPAEDATTKDKIHVVLLDDLEGNPQLAHQKVKVFINGCWVAITEQPVELYNRLKWMKCRGIINIYTSVSFNFKRLEIRICNESGRLTRPLLRIDENKKHYITPDVLQRIRNGDLNWDNLLTNCFIPESIIEYVDPEEHNCSVIAMFQKDLTDPRNSLQRFTHCEIHPSTKFGIIASCIPFINHNQSPRNAYQSAQSKQAIGVYMTNFQKRMDKTSYVMTYPMRPLVDTRIMNMIKINEIPSGGNVIVAIMTYTGYNQEDSILINKGAIDRGLFQITVYHTEKDEDKQKSNGDKEIRCKPDPKLTKSIKFLSNYEKVNAKGVIPENTKVENRDIIIAKVVALKRDANDPTADKYKFRDISKVIALLKTLMWIKTTWTKMEMVIHLPRFAFVP